MIELLRYQRADGREPFTEWLDTLRDKVAQARIRIRLRQFRQATLVTASRSVKKCQNYVFMSAPGIGCILDDMGNPL
jgi:hypothetical protein